MGWGEGETANRATHQTFFVEISEVISERTHRR
jgi:hypothetical protein